MLNYYHKYLSNLADILEPLHNLLRKNIKWKRREEQTKAFEKVKHLLCSERLLLHFDPNKPLILACDASPYGLGTVLFHVLADGTEKPIAYICRTLTSADRNYSQIEKESLAVEYSTKKFHQVLYGRDCTVITDNKELLGILSEENGIPTLASSRIQRWGIILATFNYKLRYKSRLKNANADCWRRLPDFNLISF